jgi:hypothetical protein
MNLTFDRNLFTQIGLDSGSLTMLGAVIHSFQEPGDYRGSVRKDGETLAAFQISVDKNSPVAQVNIDLSTLTKSDPVASTDRCGCEGTEHGFSVNPKGYAVFHVTGGAGGYDVHVRKASEDPNTKVFDSRKLSDGDIFSAIIIRPGTYQVTNVLGSARAEVEVSYPEIGETAYRPPPPVRVQTTSQSFEPSRIKLKPGQGLLFECKYPSRIRIELIKPNDGPEKPRPTKKRGWKKTVLPNT